MGKALYARTVIEITFGLWLILLLRDASFRLPRSWLVLAFGIYLAVNLLASSTGVSPQRSIWSTYERMQGTFDLAHWFIFILITASVFRSWSAWRLLLNFSLGVSLVVALLGVAQHNGATTVPIYRFLEDTTRVDITLGNPSFVGAYMLVNVFIGLALFARSLRLAPSSVVSAAVARRLRTRRAPQRKLGAADYRLMSWRVFWLAAIALDFWILVLTGTRGSFVGVAGGLAVFALGYVVWGNVRALRLATLGLLLFVVLGSSALVFGEEIAPVKKVVDSSVMARRVFSFGFDENSIKSRLASWSAGLEGFAARPLFGWGPENFEIAYERYIEADHRLSGEEFDKAHNKPVEELVTKGALGFASYAALWVLMAWIVVAQVRRLQGPDQLFALFIGAALAGYFIQNLFLFDTPATLLQFMLLVAFAVHLESAAVASDTRGQRAPGTGGQVDRSDSESTGRSLVSAGVAAGWNRLATLRRMARVVNAKASVRRAFLGLGLIGMLVAVGAGAYFLNYRPYSAASAVNAATRADPDLTWDQRLGYFDRAIDAFPPLANQARLFLFATLEANWEMMTQSERDKALPMAEQEAKDAIDVEPQGSRIYVSLARLYHQVARQDSAYLDKARLNLELAGELAPKTVSILKLRAAQTELEEQLASP